jgi:hypothetical protein
LSAAITAARRGQMLQSRWAVEERLGARPPVTRRVGHRGRIGLGAAWQLVPSGSDANICSGSRWRIQRIYGKARELRATKRLSLDEIAERMALPTTTVYCWIADLPLGRPRRENPHPGTRAMQRKYRKRREDAYARGHAEYDELITLPAFREFVVLYVAEGSKRNRNMVAIGNSDDRVIAVAATWLRRLTSKELTYSLQYHADQDLAELRLP